MKKHLSVQLVISLNIMKVSMPNYKRILSLTICIAILLSFYLAVTNSSLPQIDTIINHSIIINASYIIFYSLILSCTIFIVVHLIKAIFVKLMKHKEKNEIKFSKRNRCIILNGEWGTGKTYYYECSLRSKIIKYYGKPIEIPCFSATKDELILNLILSNPIYNIISLHGILSSLMKNNWMAFMPKKKVIVFDDFERLGGFTDNKDKKYADVLGIINYLKQDNYILLIANINKTESNVLNSYLEKITDGIINVPIQNYEDIFDKKKNEIFEATDTKHEDQKAVFVFNVLNQALSHFRHKHKEENIRLLLNLQYYLFIALKGIDILKTKEDYYERLLIEFMERFLRNRFKALLLFFRDHKLYSAVQQLDSSTPKESEEYARLEKELKTYEIFMSDLKTYGYEPLSEDIVNTNFYRELTFFALKTFPNNYQSVGKNYLTFILDSKLATNYIDDDYLVLRKDKNSLYADILMWHIIFHDHDRKLSERILKLILKSDFLPEILKNITNTKQYYYKYWQASKDDNSYEETAENCILKHLDNYLKTMQEVMSNDTLNFVLILMENKCFNYVHDNNLYHTYFSHIISFIDENIINSTCEDYDDLAQSYWHLIKKLEKLIPFVNQYKDKIDKNLLEVNSKIKDFIKKNDNFSFSPGFFTNENRETIFSEILVGKLGDEYLAYLEGY